MNNNDEIKISNNNQLQIDQNGSKVGRPAKKEKSGKWKIILIIFLAIIWVFAVCLIIHFLFKSCNNNKNKYKVHIEQPLTEKWKMKVNNSDKDFYVNKGDQINVKIYPNGNYSDCLNAVNDDLLMFYVQVSPTIGSEKNSEWTNELSLSDDEKSYETHFEMSWDYDITLSIKGSKDYEESYYSKENDEVKWVYQKSSLHELSPDAEIIKISIIDLATKKIKKSEFDEEIFIGKKIKELTRDFLANCTNFNKPINFDIEGSLQKIENNFLYNCSSFNQKIGFPDSLTTISGDFMSDCKKFNQEFNFNNISDVSGITTVLYNAESFNSKVTIGSKLTIIPKCFLVNCKTFNQNITIPSQITTIKESFLCKCYSMCSTITVDCDKEAFKLIMGHESTLSVDTPDCPSYQKGIKTAGKGKDFKDYFPELNGKETKLYRKWA